MRGKLVAPLALAALATCRAAERRERVEPELPRPVASFDTVVAPILAQRCSACHGEKKDKGGLRLHTREGLLAGGESGPVVVAGDAASSELVRRLRLPLDDLDHMPPDDKPQPSEDELRALEAWIAAGAPFEGHVEALAAFARPPEPERGLEPIPAAPREALDGLRAELVHVEPSEPGSNGLRVDFAAVAERTDDALALRLLAPVREQVVELSLARSPVGDAALELVARMPRLRRLDLSGTAVTDAGLARLAGHAALVELVLARTRVGDASLATLESLPALRRLYVWRTALGPEPLARLRARPELAVDAGDVPDAAVAEVEPEPVLTSDAPIPGAPPPGSPDAPVNATCPVTGSPVNAKYVVEHEGRKIGFCCPNCPAVFQADPAKYAAKLPEQL
jgi:hypothetical protein